MDIMADNYVTPLNSLCGDGYQYLQTFVPNTPSFNPILLPSIPYTGKYCSGRNLFKVKGPIIPSGLEHKWTFNRTYNGMYSMSNDVTGFEMNEFNPEFGLGNPTGTGTVTSFNVELRVSTGCKPWSSPISTSWIQVSYNCNPINGISSNRSGGGNSKSQTQLFDINIYPNPSNSGIFNINVSGIEGDKTIHVMDISGKLVCERHSSSVLRWLRAQKAYPQVIWAFAMA